MAEYIIIIIAAAGASALTFFSGFGLGTILVPVFAMFFPIELAIALTAIVHFLNNIFKLFLVGKNINKEVLLKFGIPAIISAFGGAMLLAVISELRPIASYTLLDNTYYIMPVKVGIAVLIIFFSLFDILPRFAGISFNKKMLPFGGLLSGFFGGLSGNQGALRSAFLIKAGLTKEAFIATGIAIAVFIDASRLTVYFNNILLVQEDINYSLLTAATLSAFAGAVAGKRLLTKITIRTLQLIVGIMLIVFSLFLGSGLI